MIRLATIGDIHVGACNSESLSDQLENEFFKYMRDFKPDYLINLGDITDHKLLLNSLDAELFLEIGYKMKEVSKEVIIVNGTLSHEQFQTRLYKRLIDQRFRIIYRAEVLHFNHLEFLILPEEYDLKNDYYKDFLNPKNKYDFVFGHGMFSHVGNYARNLSSIIQTKHARVWDWKDFQNNVYGFVVFGHIHIGSIYKNIIYPSSFSRDSFGEEEPKGFYIFEYDEIKKKVIKKEFIENKLAPKYKDIKVSDLPTDIESLFEVLREFDENSFKLRIVIDIPIDDSLNNNLQAFAKNRPQVSIIRKIPKHLTKTEELEKEKSERIHEKLNRFKGLDFFEITKMLAKEQDLNISTEEINQMLNKE